MLDFFKNLFVKKTPEGVIKLNDLHFIACSAGNNVNTITWDTIKKEIKVFHINNEAMKEMYGSKAYDLNEYGYLEVFNHHENTPYLRAKIDHKGGEIIGFENLEEYSEIPSKVSILES